MTLRPLPIASLCALLLLSLVGCGEQQANGTNGTAASEAERSAVSMKLDDVFNKAEGMSRVRVAALRHERGIALSGYVTSALYRDRADSMVRAVAPDWKLDNKIRIGE